jgi:hypothetical protein
VSCFLELANRGNKTALVVFNDGIPASSQLNELTAAGDGYLMREGYTLVWFGWQRALLSSREPRAAEHGYTEASAAQVRCLR